jgi:type I restriction enzyme S subunit
MLPDGWAESNLDPLCKVIDCKHRTPSYIEEGIPLVSPGTIKWGAIDLKTPSKRVSEEEYQSLMDHCTVDIGDLVLSRNQSVGVVSYIDKNEKFVLGQDTVLIKPVSIKSKYLYFSLQSTEVQRKIIRLSGGSTFSRINLKDIRKLKLKTPPIEEQTKIAEILSTWDKAINTLEKVIGTCENQKKGLIQKLLA